MTDRELLGLAARAAGLCVKFEEVHGCYWIELGQGIPIDVWDPIDHDGDALRLAVKLRLIVCCHDTEAWAQRSDITIKQPIEGDRFAATRRAIVRAAAAIAAAQQTQGGE